MHALSWSAQLMPNQDSVSERLRRWTRNPWGSARRGSNPLAVGVSQSLQTRPKAPASSGTSSGCCPASASLLQAAALHRQALSSSARHLSDVTMHQRQRVRAAKEMDPKSIGLCPQGFESPQCRCALSLTASPDNGRHQWGSHGCMRTDVGCSH